VTLGGLLVEARRARGVTLEQAAAATRVRLRILTALEGDLFAELPAPVYVRGYLRTYASYLEIDPNLLLQAYEPAGTTSGDSLAIRPMSSFAASPSMVLTAPAAGAIGLILLVVAFTGYVYRELESVRTPPPQPRAAATALPSPSASPGAAAAPTPAPSPTVATASVTITATDVVWIDVQVDGKPQYADSGKVLQAGDAVNFSGLKVKVTSGKGGATLVAVNGRNLGPMGGGVITREYTAQT
jgi:cytoskeleton protein RodZ